MPERKRDFSSSSRQIKILTTGIHIVFRGLKFLFNAEIGGKGHFRSGTTYIKQILDAKPDAVWSPLWGADAVNFIKQALPTGIFDNIVFAFPCAGALEVLVPMGKDMPEGIYVSSRYFFTASNSGMNNRFVKAYYEKYKEYPDYMASETYAGVYFIKAAVERAGTTDTEAIIKAVEYEPLA